MEDPPVAERDRRSGDGPRDPFLRCRGQGSTPEGWVAEPVRGLWQGQDVEVVYNPRRHDVAFFWEGQGGRGPTLHVLHDHGAQQVTLVAHTDPGDHWKTELEALGWRQRAVEGPRGFWTRDRSALAHAALERSDVDTPRTGPQRQARTPDRHQPPRGELTI